MKEKQGKWKMKSPDLSLLIKPPLFLRITRASISREHFIVGGRSSPDISLSDLRSRVHMGLRLSHMYAWLWRVAAGCQPVVRTLHSFERNYEGKRGEGKKKKKKKQKMKTTLMKNALLMMGWNLFCDSCISLCEMNEAKVIEDCCFQT